MARKEKTAEKKIRTLTMQLEQRKSDQQQILLERIRDRDHAEIYSEMLTKCETDIDTISKQIDAIRDYDATIKKRKAEMKSTIDLIDEIVAEGAISDSHLRMLVDSIVIHEKNKKLEISIFLKAEFRQHIDFYDENGEITEKAFEMRESKW